MLVCFYLFKFHHFFTFCSEVFHISVFSNSSQFVVRSPVCPLFHTVLNILCLHRSFIFSIIFLVFHGFLAAFFPFPAILLIISWMHSFTSFHIFPHYHYNIITDSHPLFFRRFFNLLCLVPHFYSLNLLSLLAKVDAALGSGVYIMIDQKLWSDCMFVPGRVSKSFTLFRNLCLTRM